jgi:hypothetical protein
MAAASKVASSGGYWQADEAEQATWQGCHRIHPVPQPPPANSMAPNDKHSASQCKTAHQHSTPGAASRAMRVYLSNAVLAGLGLTERASKQRVLPRATAKDEREEGRQLGGTRNIGGGLHHLHLPVAELLVGADAHVGQAQVAQVGAGRQLARKRDAAAQLSARPWKGRKTQSRRLTSPAIPSDTSPALPQG